MKAMPSPALPATGSDRGNGGDMGRSIQGLEDLHHGFPVDGVGERHRGFAFETVVGTGHHLGADFKGYVLHPDKSFQRLVKYRLILGGQLVIWVYPPTNTACSDISNSPSSMIPTRLGGRAAPR